MKLIVGLGNPGKKYQKTRHNLGRMVVSGWQRAVRFPKFKFHKNFNALISKGIFGKGKVILALPETFMNESGKAVKSLTANSKLPTTNFFIIHDDLDLPLGKIKISFGRGSAGHKGVQSIIDELGSKNFIRFRIGIKPVSGIKYQVLSRKLEEFVLGKFTKKEERILKEVIEKTIKAIEFSLKEGLENAMNRFNK